MDAATPQLPPKPAMCRLLTHISRTPSRGRSYDGYGVATYAVLTGAALSAGYVREVRHRDGTRDHRVTDVGRAALEAAALFPAADLAPPSPPSPPVRHVGPQDPRNPYKHAFDEAAYRGGEG